MERIGFVITEIVFLPTKLIWSGLLQFFPSDDWVDRRIRTLDGQTTPEKTIKAIYLLLGILDTKASALMRFNGIILAVIALMLRDSKQMPPISFYVILYMTLASIIACLVVVGIFWRFYEFVDAAPEGFPAQNREQEQARLLARELIMLRRVLRLREAAYQIAWWLAGIVSVLLILNFTQFVQRATAT